MYQIPLIKAALGRGWWVAAASYRASDAGLALVDEPWVVDTTDWRELLVRCSSAGIDVVVTSGTDVAVPTLGALCDRLDLLGVSASAGRIAADKAKMQARFSDLGVPAAASIAVRSVSQARDALAIVGLPAMIKAPDSSGSRGVTAIGDPSELEAAFAEAKRVSRTGQVLVEERLIGTEFGAQLVVGAEGALACFVHNDTVTPPPISVPVGHSLPCRLPSALRQRTFDVCAQAATALGIERAVCNVDLITDGEKVFVLEIGARAGATGIPELVQAHHGVDLYEVALDLAAGLDPDLTETAGRAAAFELIRSTATGELVALSLDDEWRRRDDVLEVTLDPLTGTSVRSFQTGPDRLGGVLVCAETANAAESLARRTAQAVTIVLAPPDAP